MRKIAVLPYDPVWAEEFLRLRLFLEKILGDTALAVEHVGSTSVEGLSAKPIIDIDVVVRRRDMGEALKKLRAAGYFHQGDLGIIDREAFDCYFTGFFPHHLYLCPEDSRELYRHLTFRDHLRSHPEDREAYSQIKLEAARLYPFDIEKYLEHKGTVIQKIYQKCGLEETV